MDPAPPASFWDGRYGAGAYAYGERASRLLMAYAETFTAGRTAPVPACGEGRDAVFLATCGMEVTAVDFSGAGLAKASQLSERRGVSVEYIEADLVQWDWPIGAFDVIAAMFLHLPVAQRAGLHARMLGALKPEGRLFLEGFTPEQLSWQQSHNSGGPPVRDMLFAPDDIRADFAGAETLAFWTGVETLEEGPYHTGPAALVRAVFRKPE